MTNIVDMMNYIRRNWEMIVEDIENGTVNKDVCEEGSRKVIMPYIKKIQGARRNFERSSKKDLQSLSSPGSGRAWHGYAQSERAGFPDIRKSLSNTRETKWRWTILFMPLRKEFLPPVWI
jgi:hypothetical protein